MPNVIAPCRERHHGIVGKLCSAFAFFHQEQVVDFNLDSWVGQVTTGHGAMILGPTMLAAASGTINWQTAVPFLAAGVIGLLWPENVPMQTAARTAANDAETLIAAYRTGLSHGAAGDVVDAKPSTAAPASHAGAAMSAIALLAAGGVALGACANQTPAQQAATAATVASGLVCLADATGKIVTTATTTDPNAVKAANAAIAAGNALMTDSACQTALANGAVALQSKSAAQP